MEKKKKKAEKVWQNNQLNCIHPPNHRDWKDFPKFSITLQLFNFALPIKT